MKKEKYLIYMMAFLIPILLLIIVLFTKGVGLNAEKILVSDMHSQYTTLFLYFKRILNGNESIFYSFNNGLGGSMYATFAYYLASPLNLLVVLFNENNIPQFVMLLLFMKIGLCGLTMNIYIQKHFKLKFESLIFSTCYALMAYVINYYFNIMWLDGVFMLPLVLLGIDRLLKKNKFGLYVITLFITIFSNFYIGYMICIFSCIYFIQELLINYKKNEYKYKIKQFIKYSLLSGLLASFLLIPVFFEMKDFSRSVEPLVEHNVLKSTLQLFSNFYIGSHHCTNLSNDYGTFIFCGLFILFNTYLYFLNNKISKKDKKISLIILMFLIISCIIPQLKYAWHGFSYPNSFNNRFSFVISFYLIFIAIKNYVNIDKSKVIFKDMIFIIIYNILGILILTQNYAFFDASKLIVSNLFLFIYMILNYLISNKKIYVVLIFAFTLIEIIINSYTGFNYNKSNSISFADFRNQFCNSLSDLDKNYRLDQNYLYGGLDSILCDYSGITSFVSTNSKEKYNIVKEMGYIYATVSYANVLTNTPIADSLMGIKYNFSFDSNQYEQTNKQINITYFNNKKLDNEQKVMSLYENNNALKLGYIIESNDIYSDENVFEYQNNIMKKITGIDDDPLKKVDYDMIDKNEYKIYSKNRRIYIKINYEAKYTFYYNDIYNIFIDDDLYNMNTNSVFYFDSNKDINILKIKLMNDMKINSVYIYYLDEEVYQKQINILKENQINNVFKEKNRIMFDIDTNKKENKLFLSIPYSPNWIIYDNGKKINYNNTINFITLNLDQGNHNIKMIYFPKYLRVGIIFSLVSLIFLLLNSVIYKKCKVHSK